MLFTPLLVLRRQLSEEPTNKHDFLLVGYAATPCTSTPTRAREKLRVEYSFATAGWAKAELYNALGQKIAEQNYNCTVPNAICSFELPLSMLQSGLYFLRISNGEEQHQGKFVVTQ